MINSNVSNVNVYVGSDGKIHFKNSAGADTALNFNKGDTVIHKSISIGNTWNNITDIGFRPKFILVTTLGISSNLNITLIYDEESLSGKYRYLAKGSNSTSFTTKTLGTELDILNNGFAIKVNGGYAINNALAIIF